MTITFSILTKVIIKLIMMIISASVITMRIVSGAGSCSPSSSAGEYFFLPQKRIIDARGRWYWNSVARSLKQLDLRLSNDPLGAVREQFFIPVFSSFFFFFFFESLSGSHSRVCSSDYRGRWSDSSDVRYATVSPQWKAPFSFYFLDFCFSFCFFGYIAAVVEWKHADRGALLCSPLSSAVRRYGGVRFAPNSWVSRQIAAAIRPTVDTPAAGLSWLPVDLFSRLFPYHTRRSGHGGRPTGRVASARMPVHETSRAASARLNF